LLLRVSRLVWLGLSGSADVDLVLFLIGVNLLAVIDLDGKVERLVLYLLSLYLPLGRGSSLLLGRLRLLALGLGGHLWLPLRGHFFLLVFFHFLFLGVIVSVEFQGLSVFTGELPFIIVTFH